MSQANAYSRMAGRAKDTPEDADLKVLNEERAQLEAQNHQRWLAEPETQGFLNTLKLKYESHIEEAMKAASIGNDAIASRLLIRARTIKETIEYGRRSSN